MSVGVMVYVLNMVFIKEDYVVLSILSTKVSKNNFCVYKNAPSKIPGNDNCQKSEPVFFRKKYFACHVNQRLAL